MLRNKRDYGLMIFADLDVKDLCHCAQVCRAWSDVVQSRELWECTDLSCLPNNVDDRALAQVVDKHRPIMTKLNLLGCGKRGYTIKDLCKAVPWLALEPGDMADPDADFVAAWLIEPVKGLLLG